MTEPKMLTKERLDQIREDFEERRFQRAGDIQFGDLLDHIGALNDWHEFKENLTATLTAANAEIARLRVALTAISKIQRDKLEWADPATLFMVLDNKVDIACAALNAKR